MNTVQIANILGCNDSSIGRILRANGVKPYHPPNEIHLSDDEQSTICEMYKDGYTTVEICGAYNVCDATIAKIIRSHGIEIRPAKRRSLITNHNYFEVIDTPSKAYMLGWMISDGCIIDNLTRAGRSDTISLEIHNDDRYILEFFARELGASSDIIKTYDKRNHSHIRFASKTMSSDLSKYGVVPRKSYITYLPLLDSKYMPHLIRGIFDGDGTVTIDKSGCIHFAFYGSYEICNDISEYLHNIIGINKNKVSKSTCYHVWWGGSTPSSLFANYIYKDCGDAFLARKRDRFQSVL